MFEREQVVVPIVCVEFYEGLLFIGIGSEVHVYDTIKNFECLTTFQCLTPGTLIRGIKFLNRNVSIPDGVITSSGKNTLVVVFGQKETVSFCWDRSLDLHNPKVFLEHWRMELANDWIWDVMLDSITEPQKLQLVRITAHNVLEIWDFTSQQLTRTIASPDNSILYSASIFHSQERGLLVGCGTVFNQVLVWAPLNNPEEILIRLIGHEGVIFSVEWNSDASSIISTSDDRSAKIWNEIWESSNSSDPSRCITLYGHTARVWRSKWIGEVEWLHAEAGNEANKAQLVLTCSEDLTCRVWDATTSKCVGIYHGHTGKNVWSIAIDPSRHVAVSGGADGAVKMWSILSILDRHQGGVKSNVPFPGKLVELNEAAVGDYVQVLEVLDAHRVLVATRKGFLALLRVPELQWEVIHYREDTTFRFMCTSPISSSFSSYVVLGEDGGYLTLLPTNTQTTEAIRVYAHKRITSLFWPEGDQIFSGGYEGNDGFCCKWWSIDRTSKIPKFQLRATLTAETEIIRSLIISPILPGKIIAGDAKGSVFFYDVSHIELPGAIDEQNEKTVPSVAPSFSFLRLHGRERVTSLFVTVTGDVMSVGRDGRLCSFHWDDKCELASTGKIRKGVDNAEQLLAILSSNEEQLYVVGFYGGKLVVEGLDIGAQFLSIECGGLHRPHDFKFLQSPDGSVKDPSYYLCTFVKRKFIHIHQSSLLLQQDSLELSELPPVQKTLLPAIHGLQVNTILFLAPNLILTGSEDTTMKLISIVEERKTFEIQQTLRGQASSIRCTGISRDLDSSSDKSLLFSGGGEFCLVAWHLSTAQKKCVLVKKYTKKNRTDCRVMCVAAFALGSGSGEENSLRIVLIGLSNATVEVLGYHPIRREFTLLGILSGHNGALLSLQHIHESSNQKNAQTFHYLLSASTDGRILAWNLSPFVEFYQNEENKNNNENYDAPGELTPILELNQVHQSGINCFASHKIENEIAGKRGRYLLASGGDDQALSCQVLEFSSESPSVKLISKCNLPCAHRASIACVQVYENWLFSVGPDQRVSAWNINMKNVSESLQIEHKESYFSEVADISCIDISSHSSGKLQIVVGGMGIQSFLFSHK